MAPSRENWTIVWIYSTLLRLNQRQRREDQIARALQEIERLKAKLEGPRPRLRSEAQIQDRIWKIVTRFHVRDYIRAWVAPLEVPSFRQDRPGRPGPETRYRRTVKRKFTVGFEVDQLAIEYDMKSDGMYPAICNDASLSPKEILEAHKRQAGIERRFRQFKSVFELAPLFLKNEGRIAALFTLYFLAMLLQALIERELRNSMRRAEIKSLPLYPEERESKLPTANTVFGIFSLIDRETILADRRDLAVFEPELTELQVQLLDLLNVPQSCYLPG